MALTAVVAQITDSVEFIVTKRQANFDYLKRVQQGKANWLNVVKLSQANIVKFYPQDKLQKRINRWFTLGLSAGKLLELNTGAAVVRGLTQLLEEYEYHTTHSDAKGGGLMALGFGFGGASYLRTAPSASGPDSANDKKDSEPIKAALHRSGKHVVYEFLQTPQLCVRGAMDYCEVVYSLCDVLSVLYSKFLDPTCQRPHVHEAIVKADKKIKALVISKMAKDLTAIAQAVLKTEIKGLMTNLFIDEGKSTPLSKTMYNISDGADDEIVLVDQDGELEDDEKD